MIIDQSKSKSRTFSKLKLQSLDLVKVLIISILVSMRQIISSQITFLTLSLKRV